MKWAYTSRQESHATNKVQRQSAQKEIDFGLETHEELNRTSWMTYADLTRKEAAIEDRLYKFELQMQDYN
jgi:hypothetical protein